MADPAADFYRRRLAETEKASTEIRLIRRAAFVERYLIAVAQGGRVASAEFDIPHAANLFDVLYPKDEQA
jgi:hypothetical protein